MSTESVMSVRLAAELDHAFARTGWTAADVKELTNGDTLAEYLAMRRGTAPNSVETVPFRFGDLINVSACERLDTSVHFKVRKTDVLISHIEPYFHECFSELVEEEEPRATLLRNKIIGNVSCKSVNRFLQRGLHEVSLSQVWYLMSNQGHGESGVLHTNTRENLFLVRDFKGSWRFVSVRWSTRGWNIFAMKTTSAYLLMDGDYLFSRTA